MHVAVPRCSRARARAARKYTMSHTHTHTHTCRVDHHRGLCLTCFGVTAWRNFHTQTEALESVYTEQKG